MIFCSEVQQLLYHHAAILGNFHISKKSPYLFNLKKQNKKINHIQVFFP